jgi:hypothetical protein
LKKRSARIEEGRGGEPAEIEHPQIGTGPMSIGVLKTERRRRADGGFAIRV